MLKRSKVYLAVATPVIIIVIVFYLLPSYNVKRVESVDNTRSRVLHFESANQKQKMSDKNVTVISDSDEDDVNLPSAAECDERCEKFVAVTATNSAFAMMMLQDNGWDLQAALDAFYSTSKKSAGGSAPSTVLKQPATAPKALPPNDDKDANRVRVLSWNIDGLDDQQITLRTNAICDLIKREKPQIVLLQEVVQPTQTILESQLPMYHLIPAAHHSYYTAILLRVGDVKLAKDGVLPFPHSVMGRNILDIVCTIKNIPLRVMTSHLESTKDHGPERLRQLKIAFDEMNNTPDDMMTIFGGDLNLRDSEVKERGGIPSGILDVWETTGSRPIARYTWDASRNNNIQIPGKFKPKTRFDRLYVRPRKSKGPTLKPVYFELVGLEKVPNSQYFPSDHWGILAHFDIIRLD